MARLEIDREKCLGCGSCVDSCAAGALTMEDGCAVCNAEKCVLCRVCISVCPVEAISVSRSEGKAAEASGVMIFAQCAQGSPIQAAYELTAAGRRLADDLGCELIAAALGSGRQEAQDLVYYGADRVFYLPQLTDERDITETFGALCAAEKPEIVLVPATSLGRSIAPRLAARMKTGLTADCTALEIDTARRLLRQTRPAFGGNLMADIFCPSARPQMATVRPGVMPAGQPDKSRKGSLHELAAVKAEPGRAEVISSRERGGGSIASADVIVSVGKGIGQRKNMRLAYRLAELLGGEVGVTRPLVDAGWAEQSRQIGQTGTAVSPKLLICCGISGAVQHLAGMGGAKTVVAINSDPDAPIFSAAHYKVVGDCVEVMTKLIEELEK